MLDRVILREVEQIKLSFEKKYLKRPS